MVTLIFLNISIFQKTLARRGLSFDDFTVVRCCLRVRANFNIDHYLFNISQVFCFFKSWQPGYFVPFSCIIRMTFPFFDLSIIMRCLVEGTCPVDPNLRWDKLFARPIGVIVGDDKEKFPSRKSCLGYIM